VALGESKSIRGHALERGVRLSAIILVIMTQKRHVKVRQDNGDALL